MTKKGRYELLTIFDRSGSMGIIVDDMVGGYNSFIEEQRVQLGNDVNVSLYSFDNFYEVVYDNVNIDKVKKLTVDDVQPRGSTALYDACCRSIDKLGERLNASPDNERPEKVIVMIITDGQENCSKMYNKISLKERIREQTDKYGWGFLFLAANQDAMEVGRGFGVAGNNTFTYEATSKGVDTMYSNVRNMVNNLVKK
jgi:hypothetical protein